ncbi:GRC3 [Lepeophtheirus salmonis]|uniref:Polynucleotide 5'-hydroxyl-kinase NOL9 n=1 Tax=Lepeophtheirus salmonis TaxID=72036 RepID=A0A7R8H108_LEPSM|nr:GRC3 [Lepeophtheirus salmonis]CAF2802222.1 GRC3 [Lepeophtheirus salmonis]
MLIPGLFCYHFIASYASKYEDAKERSISGFKYFVVSKDGVLMSLSQGHKFYFRGKLIFKSIKGTWTVCGAKLGPDNPHVNIYCPAGYSYLSLESLNEEHDSFSSTDSISKEEKRIIKKFDLGDNSDILEFLSTSSHKNKGSQASTPFESALSIRNINPNSTRLFETLPEWDIALRSISISRENGIQTPKLLVVGGKGVGKSSFTKYQLNSLLDKSPVYFIDLDPGQAEFTPPGFISVHLIKSPVIGPNFTHIYNQAKISYYIGDVNMCNCGARFLNCAIQLLDELKADKEGGSYPWIINTMGFNKGLGIVFMKNFELDFSPSNISSIRQNCWVTKPGVPLKYNVLTFKAVPESPNVKEMHSQDNWGIPEPKKLRAIVLLSYFGASLFSQKDFFDRKIHSLHELTPVKVPWSEVCVQLLHVPSSESKHAVDIMNVSLVSLGCIPDLDVSTPHASKELFRMIPKTTIVKSLGFGIIRSVDKVRKCFYLLTSLRGPDLNSVNCLSCGAILLPEGCLTNPSNTEIKGTSSPYVQNHRQSQPSPLDQPWRRHFKPKLEN